MASIRVPYLGRPENMVALPSPTNPIEMTSSRGESVSTLLSGGTAVSSRLGEKRSWPLPYEFLPAGDADVLRGFYLRLFGSGPFVFVDPTVRNVLPLDVSTCGLRSQAATGWFASAGTLTRVSGSPVAMSGVLSWAGFSGSALLYPTVSTSMLPVALTAEPMTVSVWMKASSAVSVTLRINGYDTSGAVVTLSPSVTAALTTSWQRFSVTAAAGVLSTPVFGQPVVALPASGLPASVQIACAQVEYADVRSTWQPGHGSPRVLPSAPVGRSVQKIGFTNHTFTLAEV